MCICAHVCAVSSFSIGERGWRGPTSVYEGTCCLAWGYFFLDRRKDRGVVYVFSIFNAGGSVCECKCVYMHPHTHTAHMRFSDVSPEVWMRHLEGPKNPDGLNLSIYVFIYVYKVHRCMYMLEGGMRLNCFFSLTYFFFRKEKAKDMNANQSQIQNIRFASERIDPLSRVPTHFV